MLLFYLWTGKEGTEVIWTPEAAVAAAAVGARARQGCVLG
jgi:hypothetical protein